MSTAEGIRFKTIKVSAKGQITIPSDIQKEIGIKKGDQIILIKKGKRILLEKQDNFEDKIKDEFDDLQYLSEQSLKKIWNNKKDEIWNQYLR